MVSLDSPLRLLISVYRLPLPSCFAAIAHRLSPRRTVYVRPPAAAPVLALPEMSPVSTQPQTVPPPFSAISW